MYIKAGGRVERDTPSCERKYQVDQRSRLGRCALSGGVPQAEGMTDKASNATFIPMILAQTGDVRRHHCRKFGARAVNGLRLAKLNQIRRGAKPAAVIVESGARYFASFSGSPLKQRRRRGRGRRRRHTERKGRRGAARTLRREKRRRRG